MCKACGTRTVISCLLDDDMFWLSRPAFKMSSVSFQPRGLQRDGMLYFNVVNRVVHKFIITVWPKTYSRKIRHNASVIATS